MTHIEYRSIIIYILSLLIFIYPTSSLSETVQNNTLIGDESTQIEIRSDTFEVDNNRHVITHTGDVEAVRDDLNIKCQKIEIFYEKLDGDNNPGKDRFRILDIIATENVILNQADGGEAMAEKAIYNQDDEKVILTGNPAVVERGTDFFMEGPKIIWFLKEERLEVQSSEDGRPRAVLFPNK